jgi:hypothetical protein
MTHLRKIMLEELQRRHYSEATTRYYIRAVERFAQHFHCSRIDWAGSTFGSTRPNSSRCRSCHPAR